MNPLTHPSRELAPYAVRMRLPVELRRTACEDPENGEPLKVKNRGGLTREPRLLDSAGAAWQASQSSSENDPRQICIDPSHAPAPPQGADRATFDGNGDDWMRAWLEHRGVIEAIASVHYDDRKFNENGEVVIDTEDLTRIG
jgi:hypothetical protein